jgi:hypothetical protein
MDLHYFNTQSFVLALKLFFDQLNIRIIHFDGNPIRRLKLSIESKISMQFDKSQLEFIENGNFC